MALFSTTVPSDGELRTGDTTSERGVENVGRESVAKVLDSRGRRGRDGVERRGEREKMRAGACQGGTESRDDGRQGRWT